MNTYFAAAAGEIDDGAAVSDATNGEGAADGQHHDIDN